MHARVRFGSTRSPQRVARTHCTPRLYSLVRAPRGGRVAGTHEEDVALANGVSLASSAASSSSHRCSPGSGHGIPHIAHEPAGRRRALRGEMVASGGCVSSHRSGCRRTRRGIACVVAQALRGARGRHDHPRVDSPSRLTRICVAGDAVHPIRVMTAGRIESSLWASQNLPRHPSPAAMRRSCMAVATHEGRIAD